MMDKSQWSMVNSRWSIVKTYWLKILLMALCLQLSAFSFAQKISATIDKEKILIGEQVELQLKVENIDRAKMDIAKWFNLPDTFNHLEVVLRFPIDTIKVDELTTFIQKIKVTSFDSGKWSFPELNVLLNNRQSISALPLSVSVLPVDVSNMQDYHDIKDILEVDLKNDWRIIVGIVLLVIVCVFGLLWVMSKKKQVVIAKPKKMGNINPYDWAIQQLKELQQKNLLDGNHHKTFYTELISICRNFSDALLLVDTSTKTTDEYLLSMKGMVGTEPTQVKYFQLLRLADAVKFAKFIPSKEENDEAVVTAGTFIETINRFYKKY
jgi:hypothetical protein